ncbi:LuxR C-terminal-related transcriptional regulator [Jatrophihabitans endophyticus]|uniref:helix-turn-helix transcriptional regulator n=1 Tax=Jatrophihabitans endophyticus TaxID=1206085 RepID=UPI0019FC49D3|nr:LuxR C-terminal-related transcriptional regulator [Jatrophihabitans endophyticus]MBE7188454.1 hypothetical protein [Jatrophihabitans endophyticus]
MLPAPVGRQAELDRLSALLADDAPVVVLGEAGVGKTTVLRAAAAGSGRAVREGGALSTLAWRDYLTLERALGRPMVVGDGTAVAADVEQEIADGVLLADDLHWAGAATVDVLGRLAGRVAVLAGIRSGDPGSARALDRLTSSGFAVVELGGLDPTDAVALVGAVRPDLGPAGRRRVAERTGGNPLLLREIAVTGEASPSLRLALAARLRGLDAPAAEAFTLLSLAGRPVGAAALGEQAVRSLQDADLAVVTGDRVEVRHALLAEIAVADLSPDLSRALHARIARAVSDAGESARHHALAGESAEAFAAAMRAVSHTTRPGEQAAHLAVAATCASGPEADALRLRAAHALEAAHDWPAMLDVLAGLDPDDAGAQAAGHLLRARGAWSAGDGEGTRAAVEAGLGLVAGTGNEVEVRLRIERSRIPLFVDSDLERGAAMARDALHLAESTGVDVPRARYFYGTALAVLGEPEARQTLSRAIDEARAAGDTGTEFVAANNLISSHESDGDPDVARTLARGFIDRARELGLGEWERIMRTVLAALDFHAGDYDRLFAEAEDLLAQNLEPRARDQLTEAFGLALVDCGRIDEALRRLDAASDDMATDFRGRMQAQFVRVEAALWGGRPDQALALAEDYLAAGPDSDLNTHFGAISRAWALYDLGRDPGGPVTVPPQLMLRGVPLEVDGIRHLCSGEQRHAAEKFAAAADVWQVFHRRAEVRCRWAHGEAVRSGGDTAAAVPLLLAAEELAARHGMTPLLARTQRSLRAAGVRRSAPRARAVGSRLTDRQQVLLRLVGEGLTNGQIATRLGVSRHTVVTQLASASAKLGATGRTQAAALAART